MQQKLQAKAQLTTTSREITTAYVFTTMSEQLQFKPKNTPGDRYQGTITYIFIEILYASDGQNHTGNTFN